MKEYTHEELVEKGFSLVRIGGRYLGKNYGDGRQLIFKNIEGTDIYEPHGGVSVFSQKYDSFGLSELADEVETLEELETFLSGELVIR